MNEFSLIAKYFKPLAGDFAGSLNLSDDAAIISAPDGCELVITKDALSEGIHFFGNEDPALIAGKAVRTNLSDLAAKGAQPLCYFLALMLPKNTTEETIEKFAAGLKQTQEEFGIHLAGGDTTATLGWLSISITAIGYTPQGKTIKRSGAKKGDDIYVSGTIGDSATGLELLKQSPLPAGGRVREGEHYYINRYLTPQPRIKLGIALRDIAASCMDISDGLAQDLSHICKASKTGAIIYADNIPTTKGCTLQNAITGGDDYELLFTAPPEKKEELTKLSEKLNLPLTRIGKITAGDEVQILDASGQEIILEKKGFSHF